MQRLRRGVLSMAAREVIDHSHIKTAIQQVAGGDGADVSGAPGYQDFRHVSHSTIEACASAAASLRVELRESQRSAPLRAGRRLSSSGAFTQPVAYCLRPKFCVVMASGPGR